MTITILDDDEGLQGIVFTDKTLESEDEIKGFLYDEGIVKPGEPHKFVYVGDGDHVPIKLIDRRGGRKCNKVIDMYAYDLRERANQVRRMEARTLTDYLRHFGKAEEDNGVEAKCWDWKPGDAKPVIVARVGDDVCEVVVESLYSIEDFLIINVRKPEWKEGRHVGIHTADTFAGEISKIMDYIVDEEGDDE